MQINIECDNHFYKVVIKLMKLYMKALEKDYINKPLAWALYQVWKEEDSEV